MLEPNPEAKLLDVGCGDGRNTLKYATKIGTRNIHGIEIVNEYVNMAQSKNIRVYTADRARSNRKFSKLAQYTCPTPWISTFLFNQHLKEGSQNYFLA
ncbi:class I SAM-dependent methyltransferase [Thermofilum sp.]|uniref:class I SAM-dependent methyltransferase n=1 Tax=Thermofilum sp. TaxID=1961369 RepID=UPI00386B46E2